MCSAGIVGAPSPCITGCSGRGTAGPAPAEETARWLLMKTSTASKAQPQKARVPTRCPAGRDSSTRSGDALRTLFTALPPADLATPQSVGCSSYPANSAGCSSDSTVTVCNYSPSAANDEKSQTRRGTTAKGTPRTPKRGTDAVAPALRKAHPGKTAGCSSDLAKKGARCSSEKAAAQTRKECGEG